MQSIIFEIYVLLSISLTVITNLLLFFMFQLNVRIIIKRFNKLIKEINIK